MTLFRTLLLTGTVLASGYLDLLPLSRSRLDRSTALLLGWMA